MNRIDQMLKHIDERFMHHPPQNQEEIEYHEMIRTEFRGIAMELTRSLPEKVTTSREFSLTLTKLEEGLFWCNAAYARNKPLVDENKVDT